MFHSKDQEFNEASQAYLKSTRIEPEALFVEPVESHPFGPNSVLVTSTGALMGDTPDFLLYRWHNNGPDPRMTALRHLRRSRFRPFRQPSQPYAIFFF